MLRYLQPLLRNSLQGKVRHAVPLLQACRAKSTECSQVDGVRVVKLNEPKTRNSLSMTMMECLLRDITNEKDDPSLRCIVLTSSGNVWSSGHNLKELAGAQNNGLEIFNKLTEIIMAIRNLPVPVIAKVNGVAAAAGCQLVASCDMVVCSDKSAFSTPGGNFGVFCSTPGIAIARTMPRIQAAHMLFTGSAISAQDAYTAGLVSVVVPEAELDARLEEITNSIKHKSRAVIALGKEFLYKQLDMSTVDAYKAGGEAMAKCISSADGQEGVKSFCEKRKPSWSHK